ncbi:MAG: hypothetical protein ACKESB_00250 [Candidatus Hodgkinia cicadicola]
MGPRGSGGWAVYPPLSSRMNNAGTWADRLTAAVCLMCISLLISEVNSVVTTVVPSVKA